MNCEQYRQAIAADPSESFDGGKTHAANCDACSGYRQELRSLDEQIARALAIDVRGLDLPGLPPIDDADRGSAGFLEQKSRRTSVFSPPVWAGIAAGLVVAVLLVIGFPGGDVSPSLAEQVIAHMDYEQESRRVTAVPVSARRLGDVVGSEVAGMDHDIGLITYAMSCVINGRTVPHLVIQGRSGPVTLILLPDETIEKSIGLSGNNVHGVILPVGNGSVAIIGEREEQLTEINRIGRKVADTVEWKI